MEACQRCNKHLLIDGFDGQLQCSPSCQLSFLLSVGKYHIILFCKVACGKEGLKKGLKETVTTELVV